MKTATLAILVTAGLLFWAPLHAQTFRQQGPKLSNIGVNGYPVQPGCIALSADGNTALLGGPTDNYSSSGSAGIGATWVWVRSNGVWTQQAKLVGTGGAGLPEQGASCALSADGNTAVEGGYGDDGPPGNNDTVGAVWVFTRQNGVWTQQGSKLVGSGADGTALQGLSVGISADGNTMIEGGPLDGRPALGTPGAGAVWVFTRQNGVWTQQGPKLVGSGATGFAQQGSDVALSGDGNTALVGGPSDDNGRGAAWVWTRQGGVWTQQGPKLIGSGAVRLFVGLYQGSLVALSYDGSRALIAGPGDNYFTGAVWPWRRANGVWIEDGPKLIGSGAVGDPPYGASQGDGLTLSWDGNTALIGGPFDSNGVGAVWQWAYINGVWTQQGNKFSEAAAPVEFGAGVTLSGDGSTALITSAGPPPSSPGTGFFWVYVQGAGSLRTLR